MCEQMGVEPDPKRMPLEASEFPDEVQVAFFVYDRLSEVWEGMSGTYMGKNWLEAHKLLELYDFDDKKELLFFMQLYDSLVIKARLEESKRKSDAEKRKSQGVGKTYTHNVRG
tara:strand:+ start:1537 stop:1875 length:339 start_codon:yes stop_codon:yes gene_type:complete